MHESAITIASQSPHKVRKETILYDHQFLSEGSVERLKNDYIDVSVNLPSDENASVCIFFHKNGNPRMCCQVAVQVNSLNRSTCIFDPGSKNADEHVSEACLAD